MSICKFLHLTCEPFAGFRELLKRAIANDFFQHCVTCLHCDRIRRKCARLIHGAHGRHIIHDALFSTVCPDRHSATDDLSIGHKIRGDAGQFRHSAHSGAEARNHLVQDENCAVLMAKCFKLFQKLLSLQKEPVVCGEWLDDGCRKIRSVKFECLFERFFIIKRAYDRFGCGLCRNACAIRRCHFGKTRACANKQGVDMAVVTSIEL